MREEIRLIESLTQGSLSMTKYEAIICELFRNVMTIILDEVERIHWFVRGFTFSVRIFVFRDGKEGVSFYFIESTTNEAELIVLEEFGETKRVQPSGQFSDDLFDGKGSHRGSSFF